MKRQGLKAVALALFVALSGCSGLGIDETSTNSTITPPNTEIPTVESTSTASATPTPTPESGGDANHTARLVRNLRSQNTTATDLNTPYKRGGEAWVGADYGLGYEEFTTAALEVREISIEDYSSGPGKKLVIEQTASNDSHLAYTVNLYFLVYVDMIRQVTNSDRPAKFNQIEIKTYPPSSSADDQPIAITRMTERQAFLYHLRPNEHTLEKAVGFIGGQSRNVRERGRQNYPVKLERELEAAVKETEDNITIDRIQMQDKGMLITFTSDVDPNDRAAWVTQPYFIFRTIGTAELTYDALPDRVAGITLRGYSTHGDRERDLISFVSADTDTTIAYANESVPPTTAAQAIHDRTLFEDDHLNR